MMKEMKPFERKRLTPFLTSVQFPAGEVIMAEGEVADAMFFLRDGVAVATIAGVGEVRRYEGGSYFGELALLMGSDRAATVVAGETGATCYRLGADHFRDVPKYVRLSFMKHAAFAYAKEKSVGDTGLGRARAPSSLAAKSESELRRYIESTVLQGKRMRPLSQRNLDDDGGGNSSDSSSDSEQSDDDADEPERPDTPPAAAPAELQEAPGWGEAPTRTPPPLTGAARGGSATPGPRPPRRTKSVTFGGVVESDGLVAAAPAAVELANGASAASSMARGSRGGGGDARTTTDPVVPPIPRTAQPQRESRGGGGGGGGGSCCGSRPPKD